MKACAIIKKKYDQSRTKYRNICFCEIFSQNLNLLILRQINTTLFSHIFITNSTKKSRKTIFYVFFHKRIKLEFGFKWVLAKKNQFIFVIIS